MTRSSNATVGRHLTAWVLAAVMASVGCFEGAVAIDPNFRFACIESTDCRGSQVCFEGRCVAPALAVPRDAGPPEPDSDGGVFVPDRTPVSAIPLLPSASAAPTCAPSGWCRVSPRPLGFSQCAVAMAAPGVGFAVLSGKLFRLTTAFGLEPIDLGTTLPLVSVVATSPTSGVVSQQGGPTLHFTRGQPVRSLPLPGTASQFLRLHATETGDLWGLQPNEAIVRFDGDAGVWVGVPLPAGGLRPSHLAPASSDEAYANFASGNAQLQYRYAAGSWSSISDAGVRCLWGESPSRVIMSAVPRNQERLTPTGPVSLGQGTEACVVGENNGHLFAFNPNSSRDGITANFEGQWTTLVGDVAVSSMSMRGREGIACGPNTLLMTMGSIWHSALSSISGDVSDTPSPYRLVVSGDGSAYAFSGGAVWLVTPSKATKVPALGNRVSNMVLAGARYLVTSEDGISVFDGGARGPSMPGAEALMADGFSVIRMAVAGPDDVWVAGQTGRYPTPTRAALAHWNGVEWAQVAPPPTTLNRIDEIDAAGGTTWLLLNGHLYRWQNAAWLDLGAGPSSFAAGTLVAISSQTVLVGNSSGVSRWSMGSGWAQESTSSVRAMTSDPEAGTAFAVTYGGEVSWRSAAGTWALVALPGSVGEGGNIALGLRGQRAWVGDTTGTIMTKQ